MPILSKSYKNLNGYQCTKTRSMLEIQYRIYLVLDEKVLNQLFEFNQM